MLRRINRKSFFKGCTLNPDKCSSVPCPIQLLHSAFVAILESVIIDSISSFVTYHTALVSEAKMLALSSSTSLFNCHLEPFINKVEIVVLYEIG